MDFNCELESSLPGWGRYAAQLRLWDLTICHTINNVRPARMDGRRVDNSW